MSCSQPDESFRPILLKSQPVWHAQSAALGVAVLPHRGRRWLWVGLGFVAYNLALFLLLHVKSRYRLQFLPVLLLYAGCAAAWARARLGRQEMPAGWRQRLPKWAWAVASLLLLLAFGGRSMS